MHRLLSGLSGQGGPVLRDSNVVLAFAFTLIAGLSTGVGGFFTLFFKKTNTRLLSVVLGFSAGVMVYISFVELFMEAQQTLMRETGRQNGAWLAVIAFFAGILLIGIIDKLIPSWENPHETRKIEDLGHCEWVMDKRLLRTVKLSTLAFVIHNFPEGIATFASTIRQPTLGAAITLAIAIHNIPEGIAVAVPSYCATGNRLKAIGTSFLMGFSEPLGALIAYLILYPFLNDTILGCLYAGVAGIMVFISLDELLPAAREYGEHHLSMYGLVFGMLFIALGLNLIR
ncbi:MAG TPA: zinc transporter ZupT [Clostridiales bacterium]|nr:zinc transporter ZupT [Clostridiales bacterium]